MSLTSGDLQQITTIVSKIVNDTVPSIVNDTVHSIVTDAVSGLATKEEVRQIRLELKKFATKEDLERMEGRIVTAMGLLERDALTRLDEHEGRIARLEKIVFPSSAWRAGSRE